MIQTWPTLKIYFERNGKLFLNKLDTFPMCSRLLARFRVTFRKDEIIQIFKKKSRFNSVAFYLSKSRNMIAIRNFCVVKFVQTAKLNNIWLNFVIWRWYRHLSLKPRQPFWPRVIEGILEEKSLLLYPPNLGLAGLSYGGTPAHNVASTSSMNSEYFCLEAFSRKIRLIMIWSFWTYELIINQIYETACWESICSTN